MLSPKLTKHFLQLRRLIALPILLSLLGLSLAACSTASTGVAPAVAIKFACDTYGKGGTYDSTRDTRETARGVQNKNQRFSNIGCKL